MIRLISGATRIGTRVLRPEDGPFETDPKAEARLVRAGVARYCGEAAVITAEDEREDAGTGIDPSEYDPITEDEEEGDTLPYSEDELMLKTNRELETIIDELGLDLPKKANKAALVKLIMDYWHIESEGPPDLSAEAPVV